MSLRVILTSKVKTLRVGAEAKASLNRAIESLGIDAKRGDLSLARVKHG